MWKRPETLFWRLGKRFKNSGKEMKKKNQESEGSTEITNHKTDKLDKSSALAPFASSFSSATHLSYLSSVLSSLWPFEETKDTEKANVKAQRIKAVRVPKSAIFDRTKLLVSSLLSAETDGSVMLRTRELCKHYMDYPEARTAGFQFHDSVVKKLKLCLRRSNDGILREHVRQFLTLVGEVSMPRGAGVRVLSLDGGGTRGVLGLHVLEALENSLNGSKVVEVFDLIVGVSTGAIIGALLAAKRLSVEKCRKVYVELSRELFNQGKFSGMSGLLLSHAYYNTEKWKQILKNVIGEETLLEMCGRWETPKLGIVSCTVNTPTLQPYIFRTYGHPNGIESHYRGGCNHKVWEALQASAAAPGYFQEVPLGSLLYQDGGVLTNNPTALAVHEARMLWPQERIQCVVSVGSGRTVSEVEFDGVKMSTRFQEKILRIIDSATDTELVDLYMRDTLSKGSYIRFNPCTSYPYSLDEIDPKKLEQMSQDARLYISRNHTKFDAAAKILLAKSSLKQRFIRKWNQLILL
uniref:PNPLA domain-containing protein n=1 Tax=Setaria digitata TaxID=48799 RepID=A0A915PUM9_9BILA